MSTYLVSVEWRLDMPSAKKSEVLRELEAHFSDIYNELIDSGMDPYRAESEAESRMGSPKDVAQRLNAAYNTASWRSAILAAVPFFVVFLLDLLPTFKVSLLNTLPIAIVGLIAGYVSVRELVRGRRPVWLATWFALALLCVPKNIPSSYIVARSSYGSLTATTSGILLGLMISIIVIVTSLLKRTWLRSVLLLCGVTWLCAGYILIARPSVVLLLAIPFTISLVTMLIYIMMLARMLFELHPYGHAANASLFLLAGLVLQNTMGDTWPKLTVALFTGIAVIWVARVSTIKLKIKALTAALLPFAFLLQPAKYNWDAISKSLSLLSFPLIYGLIFLWIIRCWILFPMWMDARRRQKEIQPEILQFIFHRICALGLVSIALLGVSNISEAKAQAPITAKVVQSPPTAGQNDFYVGNRAPLAANPHASNGYPRKSVGEEQILRVHLQRPACLFDQDRREVGQIRRNRPVARL